MNWRRIRKWTSIVAASGFVALIVAAWFVGGALVAPANRTVGLAPADFPASSVQFDSDSGTTLSGWHLPLSESNATVILLHPIRGDRRSMLSRARLFRKHGYSTLLIDLQAHGESEGRNITCGFLEQHDVLAAVDFVRDDSPDEKVAIVGWSLGGASTLLANPDVDAIVLESVYPTVTEAIHNRIQMRLGFLHHVVAPLLLVQLNPRLGVSPKQLCPIDRVASLDCPVLIASGDRDEHTTIQETRCMFDVASSPKELVIFEGAEHTDLLVYDAAKYENQIVGFVSEALGERSDD
ncbi:alpha/beta hydrolase [Mariniblastus fucicola]|uniref:Alpha/beta hydrolase family protein n=1 Tax=Mariniblastus fucicola TaxID=980251 RepID=A0A5B9PCP8_9BACT|nr:alpha/beta fold hydrolase [Mariniblastus fucicola]QEG24098.1 Alpha/beta hydrolase family protein [Mariniblastus fucicola]